ncbi:MAG: hypothetical protein WKF75_19140, partial [Singulisphaera sp.]
KPLGPLALPCLLALASAGSWLAPPAAAQTPTPEERLKILTSPEEAKKAAREKSRPPMEFFRSQVAPFDILPYVKPNHWSTLNLELRSNHRDYEGLLQTAPVPLWRMAQAMAYRRDARLVKGQRSRLGLQMMLPRSPGSWSSTCCAPIRSWPTSPGWPPFACSSRIRCSSWSWPRNPTTPTGIGPGSGRWAPFRRIAPAPKIKRRGDTTGWFCRSSPTSRSSRPTR